MPEANGQRADGPPEQSAPARFWYQVIGPSLRGPQFLLESDAARNIEGFLNQARLVLVGCLLVLASTGLLPAAGEDLTLVLAAAGIVWVSSVALLVHFFYRPWVAIAIALLDVVWLSALIYLTGGPESPVDGLYAIVIFAAVVRFTKVHSFLFTAAVILSYVEVVSRHPLFRPDQHGDELLVRATVLAAAGMLAWFISVEVERQRRAVVEARQELASLATIDLLSRRLAVAADREGVARAVLALAEQLAPGSALAIGLIGPNGRISLAGVGGAWPRRRGQPAELGRPGFDWPPTETGEPPSLDPVGQAMRDDGLGQILGLSLGSGSASKGRLYVGTERPLRDADRALLQRLADDAGLALLRIDLLERERDRASAMGRLAEQNGLLLEQERDTVTRLRQLAMHKDNFIMMLAHELRTPLTSIRGFAQLLVRTAAASRSERGTYPEVILDRANRMAEIIDDIVDLSRMERDLLELKREPLDLAELVDRVRRAASARGVRLTIERPAELPPVKADGEKLYRAFLALVERAAKYQRGEAPLRLSLAREEAEIQLWLDVDGDVPTQRLATIFEETPVESEEPHGGLGVYICKTMVEAHGGRLWLERVESGSRFGLRLPIDATARLPRLPPGHRLTA
ncbi:MAG TPA: histidine kinase dimerization/phospho-acceptor domain-containing protein [Chloroflexota bacterium]